MPVSGADCVNFVFTAARWDMKGFSGLYGLVVVMLAVFCGTGLARNLWRNPYILLQ